MSQIINETAVRCFLPLFQLVFRSKIQLCVKCTFLAYDDVTSVASSHLFLHAQNFKGIKIGCTYKNSRLLI